MSQYPLVSLGKDPLAYRIYIGGITLDFDQESDRVDIF